MSFNSLRKKLSRWVFVCLFLIIAKIKGNEVSELLYFFPVKEVTVKTLGGKAPPPPLEKLIAPYHSNWWVSSLVHFWFQECISHAVEPADCAGGCHSLAFSLWLHADPWPHHTPSGFQLHVFVYVTYCYLFSWDEWKDQIGHSSSKRFIPNRGW